MRLFKPRFCARHAFALISALTIPSSVAAQAYDLDELDTLLKQGAWVVMPALENRTFVYDRVGQGPSQSLSYVCDASSPNGASLELNLMVRLPTQDIEGNQVARGDVRIDGKIGDVWMPLADMRTDPLTGINHYRYQMAAFFGSYRTDVSTQTLQQDVLNRFIDLLMSGTQVTFDLPGHGPLTFKLDGSRRAITTAQNNCR